MGDVWSVLTAVEAVGAAASGGAFLTYSGFTTTALAALPDREGLAAMQQVNLAAPRSPSFMLVVFGPAILGAVLGVRAVLDLSRDGAILVLAGAVVYVLGVAVLTAVFHVPRNNALAAIDADRDGTAFGPWLQTWVAGNHLRTAGGLASAALFLASITAG